MKQIISALIVCATILLIVYFVVGPYRYIPVGSGESTTMYKINRITQETTLLMWVNDNGGCIKTYHSEY